MTYQLRQHQKDAKPRLRQSFANGNKRVMFQAACGWGKSLFSIDLIISSLARGKRVCFVVDRITLIEQIAREFDKHDLDYGIIQARNERYDLSKQLQIASVQTWIKLTRKPIIDFFIVDEAHSVYKKFTDYITTQIDNIPVLGLSATPWTKSLGTIYEDLIVTESTQELIDMGYLSDFIVYGTDDINLEDVKITAGDYNEKQLEKKVNTTKIVGNIVDTWLNRGENRQTVVFAVNIAHSKSICDEFEANGVPTGHVDCHTKPEERRELLKKHDSGEIKILSNCTVFAKGWDSAATTCLILGRPTKSEMLYIQMVNRALRVSPCGSKAIILDHSGTISRLGFPTDIIKTELCDGSKQDKAEKKKEELEAEEKAPKPCHICGFMHNVFKCPNCGEEPKLNPRVEFIKAELKILERKQLSTPEKRNKDWDKARKQSFYSGLLEYAHQKGHREGSAAFKYKSFLGVWPNAMDKKRGEVNSETLDFITSKNIAYAKGRGKARKSEKPLLETTETHKKHPIPHDVPVVGYVYTKQTASNGMLQVKATLNGKYKFFASQTPEIMEAAI